VWVWGQMMLMDSSLYFIGAFLDFGERLSHKFL
jgi:hypothetical protein